MKDRYFYPLAIMFIAGVIYYALAVSGTARSLSADDIMEQGYSLSGADFTYLTAASGTSYDIMEAEDEAEYVVMRAHKNPADTDPSPGIFGTLTPAYDEAFAGQALKITVRARQGANNPTQQFYVGYFSSKNVSGWRAFEPSAEYQDYSFIYTLSALKGKGDYSYLGVWPDMDGKNRSIEIESLRIDVVQSDVRRP